MTITVTLNTNKVYEIVGRIPGMLLERVLGLFCSKKYRAIGSIWRW